MNAHAIGVDFGTTNSSVGWANSDGVVQLARFPYSGGITESYRSLLYLDLVEERGVKRIKSWSGPSAIEEYLGAETKGRLIQSLKSFLSSRTLKSTEVFGRRTSLQELIARILRDLRVKAEAQFGFPIETAVVGRPVRFVGAETDEDDSFAEERLREAFAAAGCGAIEFELEPVAAARHYEATLDRDELILIGDFGGGTSDFSLLRVGPTIRKRGRTPEDLLGNAGIGVAGDAFDARIVRSLVSPALGLGTSMRSFNKVLPAVPIWVYANLERWHHLSFLRTSSTLNMLNGTLATAFEPEKIRALLHLIREDLGYELHRAVQRLKIALSAETAAVFQFSDGVIELEAEVRRSSFDEWIADDLSRIALCVDTLIETAGVAQRDVDRVFLTGGSSFVPAVRRIFERRFGEERISSGNEFTSVVRGLALSASRRERQPVGAR